MYYQIIKEDKAEIGLVWQLVGGRPQIEYIYLPSSEGPLKDKIIKDIPEIEKTARKIPDDIARLIVKIYQGLEVNFDLSFLNLSKLHGFAKKVLKQTCRIPHGKVDTYSGLAAKIGMPKAARAVGTALASNPFPLAIPCHRVVRADGSLGGFGGGIKLKQELLKREGVITASNGCVLEKCL